VPWTILSKIFRLEKRFKEIFYSDQLHFTYVPYWESYTSHKIDPKLRKYRLANFLEAFERFFRKIIRSPPRPVSSVVNYISID
jgi:hypothetical protein